MGLQDWDMTSAFTGKADDHYVAENLVNEIIASFGKIKRPDFEVPNYGNVDYDSIISNWDGVSSDPALREEQLASLGALQEIVNGGGMTAVDEANLSRIQQEAATADKGRRDAIQQDMAMRGMSGSGQELLASLNSSQAATNRHAQEGLDVAGMAQQRALDAMLQKTGVAGDIRGQDFGEQAQKASNLDAIAQFNAQNTLANDQYNNDIFNYGKDKKNELKQLDFDNQLGIATAKTGGLGKAADAYTEAGNAEVKAKSQMSGDAIKIIGAFGGDGAGGEA